jgi:hypothetical protein
MSLRDRIVSSLAILLVAVCASAARPAGVGEEPWRGLARKIMSKSRPDSTAVIVLFDDDAIDGMRSALPESFKVVPFRHADVPNHDPFVPAQIAQMYREASAATADYPEVWVVGRPSGSPARMRSARFADRAASMMRRRVLGDSVRSFRGTVAFTRWVDRPGGRAQREDVIRGRIYADSVLALGIPKAIAITRPFAPSELVVDADSLSYLLRRLPDTTFYSVGGCSDVEIVMWTASERLGQMGPAAVPALVARIADPSPFVRERVQYALLLATQDERIIARTGGEYLKFHDQPERSPRDIVEAWWAKYGHFWVVADSAR